ncbi:MAG: class II glutamine amidotransferase [Burkholderiales bacterium]|nr:class II glutamine amidotransferase [Burkholderiales bacterium]
MCRLLAYKGRPLPVDDLLYRPDHSLVQQSHHANEVSEPLNGDGFGLGWYEPDITREPAVFVSVTPAWNNRNLRYMAPKLVSPCILAHVRAATEGQVSEFNCHPFHHQNLLMAHNGSVRPFARIKRALVERLSDERFLWIKGQTDSEHLFALFLDHYLARRERDAEAMADALQAMFDELAALKAAQGVTQASGLNMVVTDGRALVAARHCDDPGVAPASLHHTEGSHYVCDAGGCRMAPAPHHEQAVLIASEPLTRESQHWRDVPARHFVLVDAHNRVSLRPIRMAGG